MGRGLICAVLIGITFTLFFVSAKADTLEPTNIWDSNLSIEKSKELTPTQASFRYDCEFKDITSVSLSWPFTYLFSNIPFMDNLAYTDRGEKCTVSNQHGIFTSRYIVSTFGPLNFSEYFGINTSKMYDLGPVTSSNTWIDPVPKSDKVLFLIRPSGNYDYNVLMYKDFDKGHPGIVSSKLTWDFSSSSSYTLFVDKNGVAFRVNKHAFSPNGRYMAVGYNKTIAKIDLNTMEMTPVAYDTGAIATNRNIAISNNGRFVALSGSDLKVYDSSNCEVSYSVGLWEKLVASQAYAGCRSSTNIAVQLYNEGLIGSGSLIKHLHFDVNNKTLYATSGSLTTPTVYNEFSITANNYTNTTDGYLAMGDSFSSGEGDLDGGTWYEPGTDEQGDKDTFEGRNLCHISRRSYPYLIAKELGLLTGDKIEPTTPEDSGQFHSVACSGAVIHNVKGAPRGPFLENGPEDRFTLRDNQYSNSYLGELLRWQPGRIKQLDVFDTSVFGGYSKSENKPEVITLAIGGNDAGFGDTIKACSFQLTCKQSVEGSIDASNLAIRLMKLKPVLVETYKSTKEANPDARIYVHGYPIFISDRLGDTTDLLDGGTCKFNVKLNYAERKMVVKGIKYMNQIIKAAAAEAGVFYVDVEDILEGINLCSGADDIVVNGITSGNDIDFNLCILRTGCLGKESFHPNPKAHELYTSRILQETDKLTAIMPEPQATDTPTPDSFFGDLATNEAIITNNGGNYTIVIPEPKPFLGQSEGSLYILQDGLMPGSTITVQVQSTPINLAEFTVPESGVIGATILLPDELEPGAHEVHLFGTTNYAQEFDYYEPIVVAFSDTDFDGDGVLDVDDTCVTVYNSFIDEDSDGKDDACDGFIDISQPQDQQDTPGLNKGQRNPETVAGDKDAQQVLGANTQNEGRVLGQVVNLENTGIAVLVSVFVGILVVIFGLAIFKRVNQD